jgi:adenosylmethionine-8-amino-7-oxononanoate aminotransferase
MHIYDIEFLHKAKQLCQKYNILMIADEIAVGFGRTGKMFASLDISPDIMLLSKGLTGGYLPLALVVMKNFLYDSFYCDYGQGRDFLHSHSYTANPLGCCAANAVLDIFEQDNIIEQNKHLIEYLSNKMANLKSSKIKSLRQQGTICAIELYDITFQENINIRKIALANGILIRPLGNVIYIMPPYIIKNNEIDKIFNVIENIILSLKDLKST